MGFGHRVYKNYDPRATVMKESAHEVLEELNMQDDPLLKIAIELEKIALKDEYFISKKLIPKCRFLFRYNSKSIRFPYKHVYSTICNRKNCRMDITMERNDRRSY